MNDLTQPGMPRTAVDPMLPLTLAGVGFAHRGQHLLHDIDLRLGAGRTLIMGPNGAGKSLLMRLCHGLLTPTSGTIRWNGRVPNPPLALRQAMVFQRPVLLKRSALANLTYVLAIRGCPRRQRKARAQAALERFGLAQLAQRPAPVLSGGEQQRLALARAWLLAPDVLFLDEPTSALDPAAIRAVEEAVDHFHHSGTKIVMTTHDLNQARRLADDVVFLNAGRLLEHSPAERFFAAPESSEAAAFVRGELPW
ncbi:amino acid ABC transporter ATP-binding protein, PAAT family [Franzmannia pantelleriensis]|uniref:Amino acid ABC transporter ATP-binding protein, PAAT family n=1 Tax=Franzmannia pantelleriensis TaxID=48727 RepID=A0A1G9LXD8_9GAMM|nr:ATP-binding cassette domain-containing protein [Halomonas pantelleriensis]SDL66367.1 amino acid ABC transporter ATP-binding protein, PAAT family [Halomonas pantelleriensis]